MSTVRAAALLARYADCGATLGDVAGMQTGVSVPGAADSSHWLAELTPIARVLLMGAGAASALRAASLPAPALLGMVATALAGVAQIAPGQYLVSASATSPHAVPVLEGSSNWLVLPIEYAEFALGGPNITELIAEICTADATAPSATAWFPTQLCGLDAVLVRALDGATRTAVTFTVRGADGARPLVLVQWSDGSGGGSPVVAAGAAVSAASEDDGHRAARILSCAPQAPEDEAEVVVLERAAP